MMVTEIEWAVVPGGEGCWTRGRQELLRWPMFCALKWTVTEDWRVYLRYKQVTIHKAHHNLKKIFGKIWKTVHNNQDSKSILLESQILGWPKSLFGCLACCYGKTETKILAKPISPALSRPPLLEQSKYKQDSWLLRGLWKVTHLQNTHILIIFLNQEHGHINLIF